MLVWRSDWIKGRSVKMHHVHVCLLREVLMLDTICRYDYAHATYSELFWGTLGLSAIFLAVLTNAAASMQIHGRAWVCIVNTNIIDTWTDHDQAMIITKIAQRRENSVPMCGSPKVGSNLLHSDFLISIVDTLNMTLTMATATTTMPNVGHWGWWRRCKSWLR